MQSVGPNKKQKVFEEEKRTSRSEIDEVIWRRDRKGIKGKRKESQRKKAGKEKERETPGIPPTEIFSCHK